MIKTEDYNFTFYFLCDVSVRWIRRTCDSSFDRTLWEMGWPLLGDSEIAGLSYGDATKTPDLLRTELDCATNSDRPNTSYLGKGNKNCGGCGTVSGASAYPPYKRTQINGLRYVDE